MNHFAKVIRIQKTHVALKIQHSALSHTCDPFTVSNEVLEFAGGGPNGFESMFIFVNLAALQSNQVESNRKC